MEFATMDFPTLLAEVPNEPGCYIFKKGGDALYVGKAKSFRKRVAQYFGGKISGDAKTAAMLARAQTVELIVTANETEALLLEMNLIRKLRPPYNVTVHGFPYIKVTAEEYPRIYVTRESHDAATGRYLGPFTDAKAIRRTVALTNRAFRLRTCKYDLGKRSLRRPCLDYETGRCLGPCAGADAEDYRASVNRAVAFIVGRRAGVRRELEKRMSNASARQDFESAAAWRDILRGLNRAVAGQYAVVRPGVDADAVAVETDGGYLDAVVLRVREGRIVDRVTARVATPAGEPLEEFLLGHYGAGAELPKAILVPCSFAGKAVLAASFARVRGGAVAIKTPRRGEGAHLLALAAKNLRYFREVAELTRARRGELAGVFAELGAALAAKSEPRRFEMIDISNIGATAVVGSLVVFQDGVAERGAYRRYRIKTAAAPNDVAAVGEVAARRFGRLARGEEQPPDVILVDGGPNQLAAVRSAAAAFPAVTLAAFAKNPDRLFGTSGLKPVKLSETARLFLARIRDEAHRYALTYHRLVRDKGVRRSLLDDVPGVGAVRKRALLRHFGSIEKMAAARFDALAAAPAMTRRVAQALYDRLHRNYGV